ncbi:MAG: acyltransferase family protein [Acidimicrobiia bacterium]
MDRAKRNLQLDVMRGVAILLVIGRHLDLENPSGPLGGVSWLWHRIGWIGVDLFFVLSGFLIGGLLLSELDRHGRLDVRRFLVRRGLKLYPPYYVFIAGLIVLPAVKVAVRGGDVLARLHDQFFLYWPNLAFLQNYVGASPAAHTWSLSVEEHFYLLLPFTLLVLAATGRARWMLHVAVVAVPLVLLVRVLAIWTDNRYAFGMSATHLRLDALLFGVGLRAVAQQLPERFAGLRRFRGYLIVAGILLWSPNVFIEPDTALVRTVGLTGTYLGGAAFLMAAFHTRASDFGRLAPVASRVARLLAAVGVFSYAIYLWHVSVMGSLRGPVADAVTQVTGGRSGLAWLATATVLTAAAIAFGAVATKLVDWPVLRFRDRFFPSRSESLPAVTLAGRSGARTE